MKVNPPIILQIINFQLSAVITFTEYKFTFPHKNKLYKPAFTDAIHFSYKSALVTICPVYVVPMIMASCDFSTDLPVLCMGDSFNIPELKFEGNCSPMNIDNAAIHDGLHVSDFNTSGVQYYVVKVNDEDSSEPSSKRLVLEPLHHHENIIKQETPTTTRSSCSIAPEPSFIRRAVDTLSLSNEASPEHHFTSPATDHRFNTSPSILESNQLTTYVGNDDLKRVLSYDLQEHSVPISLLQTVNESHLTTITMREQAMLLKFKSLEGKDAIKIKDIRNFYRCQAAMVEMDRHHYLVSMRDDLFKDSINAYYDNLLIKAIDRIERSLALLQRAHTSESNNVVHLKRRSQFSLEAVRILECWYQENESHPYPSGTDISLLARKGRISQEQVRKWFANKRNRSSNTLTMTEIASRKRKLAMKEAQVYLYEQ